MHIYSYVCIVYSLPYCSVHSMLIFDMLILSVFVICCILCYLCMPYMYRHNIHASASTMYLFMYTYLCKCIYVYTYIFMYMYLCICIYVYVFMYMYLCICMYVLVCLIGISLAAAAREVLSDILIIIYEVLL